ncbi:hypothetical protein EDC65_1560 [Stella humosa]|uniref:Glycine zipper domain-containing protein n=1 Tax=Stella humosa TaxID=94 RepID=A0A3N1M7S5_9PROT|nr:hypothetical protein [Stella humosa]ROP99772.1 hypothetical protein EDC65_1560 [Stella humosa]BBK31001.1 hypothetical protein STHU_16350 [Stella humosa]
MRKLIAILLLCFVPSMSFAQSPSITLTPSKIEMTGINVKHAVIIAAAIVAGAVLGEAVLAGAVGNALGTLAGAAAGFVAGKTITEDMDDGL